MREMAQKVGIAAFWICLWQCAAWAVGNRILLAGPIESAIALASGICSPTFWSAVGFSSVRIAGGFCIAFSLALVCGTISWKSSLFQEILQPLVTFMKSVPVVCIIVLLLVWTGSANVSVIAVALMVFPPVYFSYLEGLRQTDDSMRQMLDVFEIRAGWRLRYYYMPAVMPFVISAAKVVVGIAWKSGVAAEVIGIPAGSIGAGIYSAKIGFSTADLFAWTFAVVALSALCEKLFLKLLDLIFTLCTKDPASDNKQSAPTVSGAEVALENVKLSYGSTSVLRGFSQLFSAHDRYCLMGPSGSGKTTLMDLICGFIVPDEGVVKRPERLSRSFQDDRLIEQLSAWGNVALVCPGMSQSDRNLLKFDLDESLGQDSAQLSIDSCSGGMKRKVALLRALAAPGSVLLLDEPFAGLDDVSRTDAIALINRHMRGRTLIVTTHDSDDLNFLQAEPIYVP